MRIRMEMKIRMTKEEGGRKESNKGDRGAEEEG